MIFCYDNCQTQMKLQESIEGGGDVVERYACPKCGKESYLGKFVYRPLVRQTSDGTRRAGVLYCKQCGIHTAGIALHVKSEYRWCPICRTPLFQYPGCNRCQIGKGELCPTCRALNLVREVKPQIDESAGNSRRGGAWNA